MDSDKYNQKVGCILTPLGPEPGLRIIPSYSSAEPRHSGNYTCKPSSSTPASIQLFVLGEEMLSSIILPSQYLLNITTICALQTYKTRAEAAIIRSAALVKIYLILMLDFTAFVQMTKLEH